MTKTKRSKKSPIIDDLSGADITNEMLPISWTKKGKWQFRADIEESDIIDFKKRLESYSKDRGEELRIRIEKDLVKYFYSFTPFDQIRLLATIIDYPGEILKDLKIKLTAIKDINFMMLFTFTLLTANEYKSKLSKILVQGKSKINEYGLNIIFKKIIFKDELLNFNGILTKKHIAKIVEPQFEFFRTVLDRDKFLFKPNKKYSTQMFDFTSELIFKGLKDYVAFEETLKQYSLDVNKMDSYRKRYKAYLKEK